ncbi:major facilitator superfamily domain-containing protein [Halteromyces radiatus]|uniref:major facilitator superfamily domain-containing protein n=1 Tax=Halteromyces radiatus TaxID=101107 RepID=UPI00221EC46A|nr:major facilitator superfamily domain-containing protein [Halteromyces radiatus]KAI8089423.1 major facilitator superfamily domain-containing protein [Halteromyces radiatus]
MTELPKWQLTLVFLCRFAEPVSFSVHLPFIYFMVRDFHVTEVEADLGYYIGLLTTAFGIAQFISAIPWGLLSDRIGRKPVIMIGLTSTIVSMVLFGLSPSYAFALTLKIICGLMDGNIGILKSMIQEMTTTCSEEQRARAFSFLQVTFGIGTSVGVMLGGFLYNPVVLFPDLFEDYQWIKHFLLVNPAFLPCFVASCISLVGLILAAFFLEETLVITKKPLKDQETTPLLSQLTSSKPGSNSNDYSTFETTASSSLATTTTVGIGSPWIDISKKMKKTLTQSVLLICATYGLIAFQNVFYDALFIVWSVYDYQQGGIGLNNSQMALILAASGLITLVTQLVFFHKLVRYFGTLRILYWSLLLSIVVFFGQGFTRLLYYLPINITMIGSDDSSSKLTWIVWCVTLAEMAIKTVCQTVMMTSSVMLINNVAPTADSLGTINGFSLCVSSLMRAIGPTISGIIWSISLTNPSIPSSIRPYMIWCILSIIALGTFMLFRQFKHQFNQSTNINICG